MMMHQPVTDPCLGAAATLVDAAYRIASQSNPAEALGEMVLAARRAGAPAQAALLLRDPAAGAWHITLLVGPAGRVAPLAGLGVPAGPLELQPAPLRTAAPLSVVFGQAWGVAGCALAARRLEADQVLSAPLPGSATGTAGMVMAFLPARAAAHSALVQALLMHAAAATARRMVDQPSGSGDRLLASDALAAAAAREIERAARFNRPLAVVAAELPRVAEIARAGTALASQLQPWDFAGRLEGDRPQIAVVLPDATRAAAREVIDAVSGATAGARMAAAWLQEDGRSFARLAMVALGRAGLSAVSAAPAEAGGSEGQPLFTWSSRSAERALTWRRGLPLGISAETVRCPRCLAPYSLRAAAGLSAAALEQALVSARETLHRSCPSHTDELRMAA